MNHLADPSLKTFIWQLEEEMYNRELNMSDFSRQVFNNPSRYYHIRNCVHSPSVRTLRQVANALGKDLEIKLVDREP